MLITSFNAAPACHHTGFGADAPATESDPSSIISQIPDLINKGAEAIQAAAAAAATAATQGQTQEQQVAAAKAAADAVVKKEKPFYKEPLFWVAAGGGAIVLVGLGAAMFRPRPPTVVMPAPRAAFGRGRRW